MDEEELLASLSEKTVVCHQDGCLNKDVPLTFLCADTIVCACGTEITDVTVIPTT